MNGKDLVNRVRMMQTMEKDLKNLNSLDDVGEIASRYDGIVHDPEEAD